MRHLASFFFGLLSVSTYAAPAKEVTDILAPPPALPPGVNPKAVPAPSPRTTLWSIGDPTDQEQYYLELINRARANPIAEGLRLAGLTDPDVKLAYTQFKVNLVLMQTEMSLLPVAPPLAMNAKLIQAARLHSNDQLTNKFQGHTGSNGSTVQNRIVDAGFSPTYYGENVYAASKSTQFGHAAFEVDWGAGNGGMQPDRGHRAISHAGFREVGIGIKEGTNGSYGPQVITQDYAIPAGENLPFVTGVAYYDFNGNNFYDPGEGIGGLTVNVEGSSYHGVTASSGGYAVPVPAGVAVRGVTFSAPGFSSSTTAVFTGSNNVRVDLKPAYAPPQVTGPANPVAGVASSYQISGVAGATAYEWKAVSKTASPVDAANDLTRVIPAVSDYTVLSTAVKHEGTASYHLIQPKGKDEVLLYKTPLRGGASASLQFQNRLAAASNVQKALVQVSTDGGATWTTVDTQTGSGNGQAAFSQRSVSLSSVNGKDFLLRFNFTISGSGSYNTANNATTGWYVDTVTFTNVYDTSGASVSPSGSASSFPFQPASPGSWLLSARAVLPGRATDFGPATEVTAVSAPAQPAYASWSLQFELLGGLLPGTLSGDLLGDFNKDGLSNLAAYAFGLSPVAPLVNSVLQPSSVAGALRLDYPRATDRPDVSVTPQVSTDLKTWYAPGQQGAPAGFSDTLISTAGNVETRRASVPASGKTYYLRVKVTKL